jgi:FdhE protein
MAATATVRVMSPEEITARAGGQTPYLHWPERSTLFAERAMRLRQLASGHPMGDFLSFLSELAQAQQRALAAFPAVPLPDAAAIDRAARAGQPPLAAVDWPRDPAWRATLKALVADLAPRAPAGAAGTLARLADADDVFLERQADALLTGVMAGLDLACSPFVAAALQVYWTHLLLEVRRVHAAGGEPLGRLDDSGSCPGCGSRPTASITRSSGESLGQRYLHCSLCSLQWHLLRAKCSHCGSTAQVAYQSLDPADGDDEEAAAGRAARAVVQAETCDDCGHYLKIVHSDRDPFVDPVADDLASLTLDLLVSDTGKSRHGVNLMLLFGEPGGPPPDPASP